MKLTWKSKLFSNWIFVFAGNGYISTDTLKEILKELDSKLTNEDLDNIIEEVDEDGSGTLDFDGNSTTKNLSFLKKSSKFSTFYSRVPRDDDGIKPQIPLSGK